MHMVPFAYSQGRSTRYTDRLHDFFTIPRCCKNFYLYNFFPHTVRLLNSLPIEYFPFTFKSRINRYLLSSSFFSTDFLFSVILCTSFSCNSMPHSDSTALHEVNLNLKKAFSNGMVVH